MRTVKLFLRLLFVAVAIFLAACEKLLDFVPNKAIKECRIKRIHFLPPTTSDHYGNVYYNKWGDPDSVIFTMWGDGEGYNLIFIYNNKRQLRELRESVWGYTIILHKYGHTKGLITSDTVDVWNGFAKQINYFKYDKFNRLIEFALNWVYPEPWEGFVETYEYDAKGNLKRPEEDVRYDNKINLHQLHPIWQFLAKDYSLNNPIPAAQYNTLGLPTRFIRPFCYPGPRALYRFIPDSERILDNSEIEYECKDNKGDR